MIPVGPFTAHPGSVDALLHPPGCRKHALRHSSWVKRLTQYLVPALQFSSHSDIWRWRRNVGLSHLVLSGLCQRRALFEFVPANIMQPFNFLTRGAQGPGADFNYLCTQKVELAVWIAEVFSLIFVLKSHLDRGQRLQHWQKHTFKCLELRKECWNATCGWGTEKSPRGTTTCW